MKRRFTREQRTTIVNGVLCILLILVVLQLWLFTATMNANIFFGPEDIFDRTTLGAGLGQNRSFLLSTATSEELIVLSDATGLHGIPVHRA